MLVKLFFFLSCWPFTPTPPPYYFYVLHTKWIIPSNINIQEFQIIFKKEGGAIACPNDEKICQPEWRKEKLCREYMYI